MTPEQTAEVEIVLWTIIHPAGFDVDLFGGLLNVRQLEDGTFAVSTEHAVTENGVTRFIPEQEWVFKNPIEAAQRFVEVRHLRKLGFDFEGFIAPR